MRYKTAIIGGGTTGLYLASKLIEKGNDVSVFERKAIVGEKVCSGLFSEKILKFIPQSKGLVENEITHAFIHFPKKTIKLNFKEKFFLISHYKLDNLLFSFVKENVLLRKNINALPEGFDRIIGCDGSSSFVRNYLNLKPPVFYLGLRGFAKRKDYSSYVETWPSKNGFIWKIPRGEKTEYGIMEKPGDAKKTLDIFLKENKIKLEELQGRIIPRGLSIPNSRTITICGDAAGTTKPWSGGGVIWGLKSAELLAEAFPDFNLYHKNLKRFFSLRMKTYNTITKAVYFMPWIIPKEVKIEPDFLI